MVLQRLRLTLDVLWRELAKFGVIGLISFVIDLGGFNLLVSGAMEHKITTAKLVSGAVATVFAWLGNRYWTFRHRRNRPVHHEVVLFFVVNGIALAVSAGWVALAHYAFHVHGRLELNVAAFIGIGFGTLFRFWAYRRFVFAHEPDVADLPGDAGDEQFDGPAAPGDAAQSEVAADRKSAKTAG
ncbi:GtrA family protein [Allobranchiibius sp. GilTou38]|nr:GtrA family protein [Allobranchiibius sp. GilTou38]